MELDAILFLNLAAHVLFEFSGSDDASNVEVRSPAGEAALEHAQRA